MRLSSCRLYMVTPVTPYALRLLRLTLTQSRHAPCSPQLPPLCLLCPPAEQLGDAYAAGEHLRYMLYCLLAGRGQARAALQRGKALWQAVLEPAHHAEGSEATADSILTKRLLLHRATCQVRAPSPPWMELPPLLGCACPACDV